MCSTGLVDSDGVGARGILAFLKVCNNFLFLFVFVIEERATILTIS
jgi:hypothetical protein